MQGTEAQPDVEPRASRSRPTGHLYTQRALCSPKRANTAGNSGAAAMQQAVSFFKGSWDSCIPQGLRVPLPL